MSNSRIYFLDYLRILAFSLVVIGHKFQNDFATMASDINNHVTLRYFYSMIAAASFGGAMGIVIFFLVSGYIISYVLQRETTLEFYLKRIFRIYPLYIFAVSIETLFKYLNGIEIPSLSILIPRLLLLGDFFGTPLSLAGVEWTLRIEVLFYAFMGLVKKVRLIDKGNTLTILLILISLLISSNSPFPATKDFYNGYFTLYTPFLFIGVVVYLLEQKLIKKVIALTSIAIMFYLHLSLIQEISPVWGQYNYAFTGTFIFLSCWIFRNKFIENKACNLLSGITYAVYLFHNWIWQYLSMIVSKIGLTSVNQNIQILMLLFLICFIVHKTIEKRGILMGRVVLQKILRKKLLLEI